MSEPINLSFWDIERIQKEQSKHITAYCINPIDKEKIAEYIEKEASACDTLQAEIDRIINTVQKETDMYYICELAKMYIESQRPAEWEDVKPTYPYPFKCSNCGHLNSHKPRHCSSCGKRMKNGAGDLSPL